MSIDFIAQEMEDSQKNLEELLGVIYKGELDHDSIGNFKKIRDDILLNDVVIEKAINVFESDYCVVLDLYESLSLSGYGVGEELFEEKILGLNKISQIILEHKQFSGFVRNIIFSHQFRFNYMLELEDRVVLKNSGVFFDNSMGNNESIDYFSKCSDNIFELYGYKLINSALESNSTNIIPKIIDKFPVSRLRKYRKELILGRKVMLTKYEGLKIEDYWKLLQDIELDKFRILADLMALNLIDKDKESILFKLSKLDPTNNNVKYLSRRHDYHVRAGSLGDDVSKVSNAIIDEKNVAFDYFRDDMIRKVINYNRGTSSFDEGKKESLAAKVLAKASIRRIEGYRTRLVGNLHGDDWQQFVKLGDFTRVKHYGGDVAKMIVERGYQLPEIPRISFYRKKFRLIMDKVREIKGTQAIGGLSLSLRGGELSKVKGEYGALSVDGD